MKIIDLRKTWCLLFYIFHIYAAKGKSLSSLPIYIPFNPLSANPTEWSNTLKQFVGNLPTICLSVFDHFVKLALKGLMKFSYRTQGFIHCSQTR